MFKNILVLKSNLPYLVIFNIVCIVQLMYSLCCAYETVNILSIRIVSVFICGILSYYSAKGRIVPIVIMAIIILLSGIGSLILIIVTNTQQPFMRILITFLGIFFTLGGIKMFLSLRLKNNVRNLP